MIKFVDEFKKDNLDGKKVLLRTDFDVPVVSKKIVEDFRIKAQKETVDYLISAGAKVLLVSHLGHNDASATFLPLVDELSEILGHTLTLVPHSELASVDLLFEASQLLLLDNIRQDAREVQNDDGFARELVGGPALSEPSTWLRPRHSESNGFDYYVNDAFAVMHRNHASVVAITKHLPSFAGFLVKKEIENLERAVRTPAEGKVLVLGGAKISTKLPVIKNFLDKCDKILIGGALANDFFQAKGLSIGKSMVDDSVVPDVESVKIILPADAIVCTDKKGKGDLRTVGLDDVRKEELILDIGPQAAKEFGGIINNAKMVIWNGPMGLFETEVFSGGTGAVAKATSSSALSIIGGGDTIAAVNQLGLLGKMSFVSTGGGAMLSFLAGARLPGLDVLGYYD